MALRSQPIAALLVALAATTAFAQQPSAFPLNYGPPAPSAGPFTTAGQPIVYPGASPMQASAGPNMSLASYFMAPAGPGPGGPPAPNAAGVPVPPDASQMYLNQANPAFQQGPPPGYGDPSAYGPGGPEVPPNYPMTGPPQGGPAGPGGYGPFPMGQPTPPRWYFRGEAVWLKRDDGNNRNLAIYNNPGKASDPLNNSFVLATDGFDFHLEPGMRLTLGRYMTDRTAIEGTYFGTNSWNQSMGTPSFASFNGAGPLFPYWANTNGVASTTAFSNANQMIASDQTTFDSFELNVRHWIRPTTSILAGFRFMSVHDQFQLAAFDDMNNSLPNAMGLYRTWTINDLYGLQVGTEYTHEFFTHWLFFSIEAKGGAFINAATERNLVFNTGTTDRQSSGHDGQFAQMVDLNLSFTAVLGDHFTLRTGYAFVFLNGLALATDQLDNNPTMANSGTTIADKGSMTLQGPFIGGECVW